MRQSLLRCVDPAGYRHLFRSLKFHRLLHRIAKIPEGGYLVEIDGPASLFSSTTKYGLQLALVLPALRACDAWALDAEAPEATRGFLLNHLITELLPEQAGGPLHMGEQPLLLDHPDRGDARGR